MKKKLFSLMFGILSIMVITSVNAKMIYQKDRNERIFDKGHHIWVQHVKINTNTRQIIYESGADAKECVPKDEQGAWLSIVLYDKDNQQIGIYDNVDIANVETAENIKRHIAALNSVDPDDLESAAYVVPIMRGTAGCG